MVPGAFPEPFLHGYDGSVRPAAVRYAPGLRIGAKRIAFVLRTSDVAPAGTVVAAKANLFELVAGSPHLSAVLRTPGTGPYGAVRFSFAGPVDALLAGRFDRSFSRP